MRASWKRWGTYGNPYEYDKGGLPESINGKEKYPL